MYLGLANQFSCGCTKYNKINFGLVLPLAAMEISVSFLMNPSTFFWFLMLEIIQANLRMGLSTGQPCLFELLDPASLIRCSRYYSNKILRSLRRRAGKKSIHIYKLFLLPPFLFLFLKQFFSSSTSTVSTHPLF